MTMKTKNKINNYDSIDLFKFISAYLVVSIHTQIFSSYLEFINFYFTGVFSRLSVYFFMIVSSYLFFNKIKFANGKIVKCKENFSILKKYMSRMTILYLLWSFIYFLWYIPQWYQQDYLSLKNIVGYGIHCVIDSSYYHMWFLISLTYAIPIMYLLLRHFKLNRVFVFFSVIYIFGLLCNSYSFIYFPFDNLMSILETYWPRMHTVLFDVIPICLSALFCDKIKMNPFLTKVLAIIMFVLYSFEGIVLYIYSPNTASSYILFTIPAVFIIFMAIKSINVKLSCGVTLRKISTVIYCIHPLVMGLWDLTFDKSINSLLYFVIISIITTVIGLIIVFLNKKIKILKYLM